MNYRIKIISFLCFAMSILFIDTARCQSAYPAFTKWYQDPLGFKPLELSTAFGFVWGSAAVAASIIFTKKDTAFRKKVSVYCESGVTKGYKWPYTGSFQSDMGYIWDIRKWMSVGMGFTTFHFTDQVNDTWSLGVRPFARWYPLKTKKITTFFEYGAGVCYSLNRFPLTGTGWEADTARTGTKFNLTSKYGVGVILNCNQRLSLQFSIRHFHLSNGNIEGIKRNPSHDSNGIFLGIVYSQGHHKKA